MKRIVSRLLLCLSLVTAFAVKAFAVWPSSESLEPDTETHQKIQIVVQKLEKDQRLLEQVLNDLKRHEQELQSSSSKATDPKDNNVAQIDKEPQK